jgi:ABC-type glycerol-3-phosphate transport system permease component
VQLYQLLPPLAKGIISVFIFLFTLGWASYGAIILIVKAEGQEVERKVMKVREIDMGHIDKRFDQVIHEIRQLREK